jgi:hypothetical protein
LFRNEVDNDRGRLVYLAGGDTGVDEDKWCSAAPFYLRDRIPQIIDLSNDKRVLTLYVAAVRALARKGGGGRPRQQQQKQRKPLPSRGTLMTTTTTRAAAVARSTRTTAGRLRQHAPLVLLLLLLLGTRRSRPPCPGALGPRGEETWRGVASVPVLAMPPTFVPLLCSSLLVPCCCLFDHVGEPNIIEYTRIIIQRIRPAKVSFNVGGFTRVQHHKGAKLVQVDFDQQAGQGDLVLHKKRADLLTRAPRPGRVESEPYGGIVQTIAGSIQKVPDGH